MGYMGPTTWCLCKVLGLSTCRAHTSTLDGWPSSDAWCWALAVGPDFRGGAMWGRLPILSSVPGDAGQLVQDSHPESPSYLCGSNGEEPHG